MNKKEFVTQIPESGLSRFLFANTYAAWLWLACRLYVGWIWLHSGWSKIHDPWWIGKHGGLAIKGFVSMALHKTSGASPDVAGWYAAYLKAVVLPHNVLFSYVVTFGEFMVGVGLVLGAFTGVAAFFGAFMNLSYMLAGTLRVNPLMAAIEVFLVLAWRVAGWIGADRFLLPLTGAPWHPGKLFRKKSQE